MVLVDPVSGLVLANTVLVLAGLSDIFIGYNLVRLPIYWVPGLGSAAYCGRTGYNVPLKVRLVDGLTNELFLAGAVLVKLLIGISF